jgi:hypothetical protein
MTRLHICTVVLVHIRVIVAGMLFPHVLCVPPAVLERAHIMFLKTKLMGNVPT